MKKERNRYLAMHLAVVNIQRFGRGYLLRKRIQSWLTPEAVEARKRIRFQTIAAVKIQAFWRGYALRKSEHPVMVHLRKKHESLKEKKKAFYDSRTLAQRYESALECITADNPPILMMNNALEDLDFISKHIPQLCLQLSRQLSDHLYVILTSASRSLPEMKALNTATLILINFYRFRETREASWNPEFMEGIVSVLLHWCDKDAPLFSTLSTLLWLFGHEEPWKTEILQVPNLLQKFLKIESLVHRKQNMVSKLKKSSAIYSFFGQAESTKLPAREANWGLDYDKPNVFTNAIVALTQLQDIFGL